MPSKVHWSWPQADEIRNVLDSPGGMILRQTSFESICDLDDRAGFVPICFRPTHPALMWAS